MAGLFDDLTADLTPSSTTQNVAPVAAAAPRPTGPFSDLVADLPQPTAAPVVEQPKPDRGLWSEFTTNLVRSTVGDNTKLGGRFLEMLGEVGDEPRLRSKGMRIAQAGEDWGKGMEPSVPMFTDIPGKTTGETLRRAGQYVAGGVGSGLGSSVPSLAIGVPAAAAGSAIGGMPGAILGFLAGAAGPSFSQNSAEIYDTLLKEGEEDLASGAISRKDFAAIAFAAGLPAAALDTYGLGKVVGINGKQLAGGLARRMLARAREGAVSEGITESLQETISQLTQVAFTSNNKPALERLAEIVNSGLIGSMTGATTSGVIGGLSKPAVATPAGPAAPAPAIPTPPGPSQVPPRSPEGSAAPGAPPLSPAALSPAPIASPQDATDDGSAPGAVPPPAAVAQATTAAGLPNIGAQVMAITDATSDQVSVVGYVMDDAGKPETVELQLPSGITFSAPLAGIDLRPIEAPKTIRLYHGGSPPNDPGMPLWVTRDLSNARGWAARSPEMGVWYVDVPADDPRLAALHGDPENGIAPLSNFELPPDLAANRKLLDPAQTPQEAPGGTTPTPVAQEAPAVAQAPATMPSDATIRDVPRETPVEATMAAGKRGKRAAQRIAGGVQRLRPELRGRVQVVDRGGIWAVAVDGGTAEDAAALEEIVSRDVDRRKAAGDRLRQLNQGRRLDVIETVQRAGGVRDDEGHDLRTVLEDVRRPGFFNRKGKNIDDLGAMLWEAGFWGPVATAPRPTEAQVLDLLREGARRRIYPPEQQADAAAEAVAAENRADLERQADELGLRVDPKASDEDLIAAVAEAAEQAVQVTPDETAVEIADSVEDTLDMAEAAELALEREAIQGEPTLDQERDNAPDETDIPFAVAWDTEAAPRDGVDPGRSEDVPFGEPRADGREDEGPAAVGDQAVDAGSGTPAQAASEGGRRRDQGETGRRAGEGASIGDQAGKGRAGPDTQRGVDGAVDGMSDDDIVAAVTDAAAFEKMLDDAIAEQESPAPAKPSVNEPGDMRVPQPGDKALVAVPRGEQWGDVIAIHDDGIIWKKNGSAKSELVAHQRVRIVEPGKAKPAPKAERKPRAKAQLTKTEERGAADIAKSFGLHSSKAGTEAVTALYKLFGGGKPGRLTSGIGFDDETYAAAKPHIDAMWREIKAAGGDLAEFARKLVGQFGAGIKPYAMRWFQEQGPKTAETATDETAQDPALAAADDFTQIPGMPNEWAKKLDLDARTRLQINVRRVRDDKAKPHKYRVTASTTYPGTSITGAPSQLLGVFNSMQQALDAAATKITTSSAEKTPTPAPVEKPRPGLGMFAGPDMNRPHQPTQDEVIAAAPPAIPGAPSPTDGKGSADNLSEKIDEAAPTPALPDPVAATKPDEIIPPAQAELTDEQLLGALGIAIERTTSKNGKPVIEVKGKTFDYRELLKRAGAKWYGPKKVWSFWSDEGLASFVKALRGDPAATAAVAGSNAGGTGNAAGSQRGSAADEARAAELARRAAREREDSRPDESRLGPDDAALVSDRTRELIQTGGERASMPKEAVDGQLEDIALINKAYRSKKPAFVLANEPGTGKTFILAGAIEEMRTSGAKGFVYVTMSRGLIDQVRDDFTKSGFGIDDIEFTTYSQLSVGENVPVFAGKVVIFDEGHNVKNVQSARGKQGAQLLAEASFSIFSSATPFENPVQAEYLAPTGLFNEAGGFVDWAVLYGAAVKETTVYNDKGRKEKLRTVYWPGGQAKVPDAQAARRWFVRQGIFTSRRKILSPDLVTSSFRRIDAGREGLEMYRTVEAVYQRALSRYTDENGRPKAGGGLTFYQIGAHRVNALKRVIESMKVGAAIKLAQQHLADGKRVVFFVETKADRTLGRFAVSEAYAKANGIKRTTLHAYPKMREMMDAHERAIQIARRSGGSARDVGPAPFADFILDIALEFHQAGVLYELPSTASKLAEAFPKDQVAFYTGAFSDAQNAQAKADFQGGKKRVFIATMAKGGTGLSLHDTSGDKPTVQININLPWSSTQFDQVANRTARYGLRSKAEIDWLFIGGKTLPIERSFEQDQSPEALAMESEGGPVPASVRYVEDVPLEPRIARRVADRMRSLGATVKGIEARSHKQLEEWTFEDEHDATDAMLTDASAETDVAQEQAAEADVRGDDPYDMAERLQKLEKGKNRDSSFGYFPTPLPVSMLMSRLAAIADGETVLEPSAGTGNLLRFVPGGAAITAIEVRSDNHAETQRLLSSRTTPASVIRGDFIEWADGQAELPQFDAILMNPPFEKRQDARHVMRAFSMLKPGGRLVAIMSEGPFFAADKHSQAFRAFMEQYGGVAVKMPAQAFKDYGTSVSTRLVVIDRNGRAGYTEHSADTYEHLRDIEDLIPSRGARYAMPPGTIPGFFSRVRALIEKQDRTDAPAGYWKQQLQAGVNKGQVSLHELNWTGMMQWLDEQEGKVAKADVLKWLDQHGITVTEQEPQIAGGLAEDSHEEWTDLFEVDLDADYVRQEAEGFKTTARDMLAEEADVDPGDVSDRAIQRRAEELVREMAAASPEYASVLTVHGKDGSVYKLRVTGSDDAGWYWSGENEEHGVTSGYHESRRAIDAQEAAVAWAFDDAEERTALGIVYSGDTNVGGYRGYSLPGGRAHRELLLTLPPHLTPDGKFTNDHWTTYSDGNVLAHMRGAEHTFSDGTTGWLWDEMQSDWNRVIREQGTNEEAEKRTAAARARFKDASDAYIAAFEQNAPERLKTQARLFERELSQQYPYPQYEHSNRVRSVANVTRPDRMDLSGMERSAIDAIAAARSRYQLMHSEMLQTESKGGVPDMPFRDARWTELTVKRALLWAAQNGYSRMAWVTGAQTQDRYDLTKHIDSLQLTNDWRSGESSETFPGARLSAWKNGRVVLTKNVDSESELIALVGAGPARALLNAPTKQVQNAFWVSVVRHAGGLDLSIGGEWATNLYDKQIPQLIEKILKLYGVKVGTASSVDTSEMPKSAPIDAEPIANNGRVNGWTIRLDSGERIGWYDTEDAARRQLKELQADPLRGARRTEVHAIDIPQAAIDALKSDGLPLLATAAAATSPAEAALTRDVLMQVLADAAKIIPTANVKVAREMERAGVGRIRGIYEPVRQIVALALNPHFETANPRAAARMTIRHEAIHFLRANNFITPREWQVLADAARRLGWINDPYAQTYRADPDVMVEEAVAVAFENWSARTNTYEGSVARVFAKLRAFLGRLRNALAGRGFQNADDVFNAIERGDVGRRQAGMREREAMVARAAGGASPVDDNFRRWFGDSKVVDKSGLPLVVYHGTGSTGITSFLPSARTGEWQKSLDLFRKAQAENERFGYMNFRSGTFFSPKPEYAGHYVPEDPETGAPMGVMYPVYIRAENPVYMDQRTGKVTGVDPTRTPDALIMHVDGDINEIAVIDPTQVKSAIANSGAYDPNNPDIRYAPADDIFAGKTTEKLQNMAGRARDQLVIPGAAHVAVAGPLRAKKVQAAAEALPLFGGAQEQPIVEKAKKIAEKDQGSLFAILDDGFRRRVEDLAEEARGGPTAPANVAVIEPKQSSDLSQIKVPFFIPEALFKRYPMIRRFVRLASQRMNMMERSMHRMRAEYDRAMSGLSADHRASVMTLLLDAEARAQEDEAFSGRFTADELAANGIDPAVAKAYLGATQLLEKAGRLVDQHERAMKPLLRNTIKPSVMRGLRVAAAEKGIDGAEFDRLMAQRSMLRAQARSGIDTTAALTSIDTRLGVDPIPETEDRLTQLLRTLDSIDQRLSRSSVRRIKGYVPHKFFGSWALYKIVPDLEARAQGNLTATKALLVPFPDTGFAETRAQAIRFSRDVAGADPEGQYVVRPTRTAFAGAEMLQLTKPDFEKLMDGVAATFGTDPAETRMALEAGNVRERSMRRWAAFKQRREWVAGHSRDVDRVFDAHLAEVNRYVALDTLKYQALSIEDRMGLKPQNKSRATLTTAFQAYVRDIMGEKQPLESRIDELFDRPWAQPIHVGMASGLAAFVATGGLSGNPLIGLLAGSVVGYRMWKARSEAGSYATRALTGELTSMTAHMKLGAFFNLFSPLVNLMQFWVNGGAVLPYRHLFSGGARAMKAGIAAITGKDTADLRLLRRFNIAPASNMTDIDPGLVRREGVLAKMSMFWFNSAERFNRAGVFLGSLEQALQASPEEARKLVDAWSRRAGGDQSVNLDQQGRFTWAGAQRYANHVTTRANFDMTAANRPQALRNVFLRVPLQFKNYIVQQLAFVAGLRGSEIPRFAIHLFLVAGVLGLPGADLVDDLAEWLTGVSPANEAKKWALSMAAKGEDLGRVAYALTRGLPAAFGADISSRAGMGENFLPKLNLVDMLGPLIGTSVRSNQLAQNQATFADQLRNWSPGVGAPAKMLEAAANGLPLSMALTNPTAFVSALGDGRAVLTSPWKHGAPEFAPTKLSSGDLAMMSIGGTPPAMTRLRDELAVKKDMVDREKRERDRAYDRIGQAYTQYWDTDRTRFIAIATEEQKRLAKDGIEMTNQQIRRFLSDQQLPRDARELKRASKSVRREMAPLTADR